MKLIRKLYIIPVSYTHLNKKYRPMKYRIDEAIVRYIGFKRMGMFPGAIPYVIKPILIGLIPQSIFKKIRRQQYNRNDTKG